MNAQKRSYISQKGSSGGGGAKKDVSATSSRHSDHTADGGDGARLNLPLIRMCDNARVLPRYSAILNRSADDGVNMDDLDQLQQDFEKLVSSCCVRNRMLRAEIESMDKTEERRDKRSKVHDKPPVKRKRLDEKVKYKDSRTGVKPVNKRHYPLPVNNIIGDAPLKHELPKINLAKNDTSDKFWATVEPFCASVGKHHAGFLDKLIEECSHEVDTKIPEVGEYYANEWNEKTINAEQELGLSSKSGGGGGGVDLKKNGLNAMVDTFANPMTQRLLSLLIEERVMTTFPGITGKLKLSDQNVMKPFSNGPSPAMCMERRLKKNLVEQGILSVDDLAKMEDEVLLEIKKCQQELIAVNEYNVEELSRLKAVVLKDLQKQEIEAMLKKVDSQVLELYNKVLLTKQKQVQEAKENEDFDKATFTNVLKEFEGQTDSLLKQQQKLQRELNELNNV